MKIVVPSFALACLMATSASAATFTFSNGTPNGLMGMASRPGVSEIEAADDFILSSATTLTSATFYGLLPTGSTVSAVDIEIYRVFPNDSTSPPSNTVPTRANSPSDVALAEWDSAASSLSFSTTTLASSFAVANSVVNGINPFPNQHTGGDGPASGVEVEFDVNLLTAIVLPADHYFFVPQVLLSNGTFLWLSSPRPNAALTPDLQAWIRNTNLDPNWLRVGTDIVGGTTPPTFNAAFSLAGTTSSVAATPEPSSWVLALTGAGALLRRFRRP